MPVCGQETKAHRLRRSQICQTQSTVWRDDAGIKTRCVFKSARVNAVSIETGSLSSSLLKASDSRLDATDFAGNSGVTGGCVGLSSQQHAEDRSGFGREQHDVDDSQHDLAGVSTFWQHDFAGESDFAEQQPSHKPAPASTDCISSEAAVTARIRVWERGELTWSSHRSKMAQLDYARKISPPRDEFPGGQRIVRRSRISFVTSHFIR